MNIKIDAQMNINILQVNKYAIEYKMEIVMRMKMNIKTNIRKFLKTYKTIILK